MTDNAQAAVWGSLAADSLALGVHWIYNTNVIDRKVGEVHDLLKPIVQSWHPTKQKGEFTHYGDQTLVLLKSLAAEGRFSEAAFGRAWQALFDTYDGYLDKATQAVRANLADGKSWAEAGSDSSDLGGAARIAPLIFRYRDDPRQLLTAVRTQTQMTHNHNDVVQSAQFFAQVTLAVLKGQAPPAAMEAVGKADFDQTPIQDWLAEGLESAGRDTRETINAFGQQCEVEAAFPATVHLLASYPDNYTRAMVANVMAGGDSASRGLMAGMVLGAHLGPGAIPQAWIGQLKARQAIAEALKTLSAAPAA
ncbi:MAG: ADP-ribosylglycohydrolase family protein [Desulfobacterales bacterium]